MPGRIIDIAADNIYLSKSRGFIVIAGQEQKQDVPLDDIEALIVHAHGVTYSHNLLAELAHRGVPLVVCGTNHSPVGVLYSVEGHYAMAGRIDDQIAAKKTLNKRLWKEIIIAKIKNQAAVLIYCGQNNIALKQLADTVRSDDENNNEAQAARIYWKLLFGQKFIRDQDKGDLCNSALNYGYAVLRACAARALIGAGLHPALGIHHKNRQNAMRLADDIMEPFRPVVDLKARELLLGEARSLGTNEKKFMAEAVFTDIRGEAGETPVTNWLDKTAANLVNIYSGLKKSLELPIIQ